VYHIGRPRTARLCLSHPRLLRPWKNLADDTAACEHSRHALWIHGYMYRSSWVVVRLSHQKALTHCAPPSPWWRVATPQTLAYSTVFPDRTPSAYTFATRFCSRLQVSCRVPKHPLTIVPWPRATRLSQRTRISARGTATTGIHLALQRQEILRLPQKPVYDPVHFAAIGR